jgi:threonine dehydrogenase-like Zn-dependent dehydrogenase
VPEIGPNDVLIKVRKASICGTDIHIWNWDAWSQKTIKVPMVIGHEFMGEIAKLGPRSPASRWATGSAARGTSPVAIAGTAAPGSATSAGTPWAWG